MKIVSFAACGWFQLLAIPTVAFAMASQPPKFLPMPKVHGQFADFVPGRFALPAKPAPPCFYLQPDPMADLKGMERVGANTATCGK
ncbi:MAG TPA: hypothetical protein VHP58_00505 [Alphaproteobacteria bacterium]|nr:hypothetical protein [Alphaproteobacteria bacterium]